MERHKCKLCLKSFANGRALGGHMRSHMLNLPVPPKLPEESPVQLSEETDSAPSSSSSEEEEDKEQFYGLRENPKRSFRLVDPEFSFAVDTGSVVLQDRESETESSKNPTRRRSKRTRKLEHGYHHHQQQSQEQDNTKEFKFNQLSKTESWAEPEPVSSISDTTNEEDVAFCLMMLSRDKWKKKEQQQKHPEEKTEEEQEEETDESDDAKIYKNHTRGKYKCETCNRVFKSYQALGGHRASHKKIKVNSLPAHGPELESENVDTSSMADKKIHECPVCFRVFSSGQALGGHKRSHIIGLVATPAKSSTTSTRFGEKGFIDLNLPAPIEDDDYSQIELSAVSDAEFVNQLRR
ncbi:hypothetical protein SLE2022_177910 [Rubroshorea leprosula]